MTEDIVTTLNSPDATLDDFVSLLTLPKINSQLIVSPEAFLFRKELYDENLIAKDCRDKEGNSLNREIFAAIFVNFSQTDWIYWRAITRLRELDHFFELVDSWMDNTIEQCFRSANTADQLSLIKKFIKYYFQQILVGGYEKSQSFYPSSEKNQDPIFRINEFSFVAAWLSERIGKLPRSQLVRLHSDFYYSYPSAIRYHRDLAMWIGAVTKCTRDIKESKGFDWTANRAISIAEAKLNGMSELSLETKMNIFGMSSL